MWWSECRCRFQAAVRAPRATQAIVLDVVHRLQKPDREQRLEHPERQHGQGTDAQQHRQHHRTGTMRPQQRAAPPALPQAPQAFAFQPPGPHETAGQRARQEPPEALPRAGAGRVVPGGGAHVVAPVMLDHELRVADARHQHPGQHAVGPAAAVAQLVGIGDALRTGHEPDGEGQADHRGPARRPRGVQARSQQHQLQRHVQPQQPDESRRPRGARRAAQPWPGRFQRGDGQPDQQSPDRRMFGPRQRVEQRQRRKRQAQREAQVQPAGGNRVPAADWTPQAASRQCGAPIIGA